MSHASHCLASHVKLGCLGYVFYVPLYAEKDVLILVDSHIQF